MSDEVRPIQQVVQMVIAEANRHRGGEPQAGFVAALNALVDHPERAIGRREIVQRIPEIESPAGAGFLAVWCGAAVENGADPQDSMIPLLDALLRWSRAIVTSDDGGLIGEPDPEVMLGLEWIGRGLVAHLSRSSSLVERLKASPEVVTEISRVEPFSVGAAWVHTLLQQHRGTLVVLHVPSRRGVKATYENLQNCFHLFTLLQHALEGKLPGAQKTPSEVLAVARGESLAAVNDSAWWHYGPGHVPEMNPVALVFGEMNPEFIPQIDGQQVLLLWPPQTGRSWGGGFFGPVIHAALPNVTVVETLSEQQLAEWWTRLRLPEPSTPTTTAPWWKFWQRKSPEATGSQGG